MARTGHIGLITRPEAFVEAVAPFAERHASVRLTTSAKASVVKKPDSTSAREKRVG
jgi:hypothetical protein